TTQSGGASERELRNNQEREKRHISSACVCSDHTTFDTRESHHTWRHGKQRPRHHRPQAPVWRTAWQPVHQTPRPPEWPRQHQLLLRAPRASPRSCTRTVISHARNRRPTRRQCGRTSPTASRRACATRPMQP
ncbi:unnamed protein product, partial [Pylaiella littoralis]